MKQHLANCLDIPQKKIKIGHAGTLDPLASGLLLVCVGQATKISGYLMRDEKIYDLDVVLGAQTTTDDNEGKILFKNPRVPSVNELEAACKCFIGSVQQLPPNFSAIKHKGKKLYEYARKGTPIERVARQVHIESIALIDYTYPLLKIRVACGKGTYMRALARDLGQYLGVGAHAQNIRRVQSGEFNLNSAVTLEQFLNDAEVDKALMSLSSALKTLPHLQPFSPDSQKDLIQGKRLPWQTKDGEYVLCGEEKQVFALGEVLNAQVKVKRLLIDIGNDKL